MAISPTFQQYGFYYTLFCIKIQRGNIKNKHFLCEFLCVYAFVWQRVTIKLSRELSFMENMHNHFSCYVGKKKKNMKISNAFANDFYL